MNIYLNYETQRGGEWMRTQGDGWQNENARVKGGINYGKETWKYFHITWKTTGYLDLEDVDHLKRASNANNQIIIALIPSLAWMGPRGPLLGLPRRFLDFAPWAELSGSVCGNPQVKKSGIFLNNSPQGLKSKNRGPLGPIHAKDGVCAMVILGFSVTSPFWSGPHLLNRGIL